MSYQFPLNGGRINATIGGNSSSAGAGYSLISTGTMLLAGGNNITLNQNGQSISLNAPSQSSLSATGALSISRTGSTISIGVPAFSAGISSNSTVSNQLILAAGNNITLSQSTNATGATVSIAGGAGGGGGIALYDGAGSISSGTARISVGGALTASVNGQTISLNAPVQSNLSATGAVSISNNGNTISIGAPAQTNQTLGMYASSNTVTNATTSGTVDARSLTFRGVGNASVGISNGSVIISASGGGGGGGGVALYDGAGSISSGTARISAGGALTASINGQTISLNAPSQSSLSATGALSISRTGSTISIGAPATSSLSGTGGFSISTTGSTISMGMPFMSQWIHNSAAMYTSGSSAMANTSASLVRMIIPEQISFTRVDVPVSVSVGSSATANTAAIALTSVGVIYSRSGSTLNPIVGQSSNTTLSFNSSATRSVAGPRMVSFGLATTLGAGEYYLGFQMSSAASSIGTATTNPGWTIAPVYGTSNSALPWADMGAGTAVTENLFQPLQGVANQSIGNTSQTFQQSQITQTGATALRANLAVIFRNN